MGIERRLMEKIPEVVAVESIPDEETGLELNEENVEKVNHYFQLFTERLGKNLLIFYLVHLFKQLLETGFLNFFKAQ